MKITVATKQDGVITAWAEIGGLVGGTEIELAEIPDDLARGYYRLTESGIERDDELYRVYRSKQVPCPPNLCKPYFDLERGWIETATPEELANWQPPETPEQKIARLEVELAAAREENLTALEAIAELYEMFLTAQTPEGGGGA